MSAPEGVTACSFKHWAAWHSPFARRPSLGTLGSRVPGTSRSCAGVEEAQHEARATGRADRRGRSADRRWGVRRRGSSAAAEGRVAVARSSGESSTGSSTVTLMGRSVVPMAGEEAGVRVTRLALGSPAEPSLWPVRSAVAAGCPHAAAGRSARVQPPLSSPARRQTGQPPARGSRVHLHRASRSLPLSVGDAPARRYGDGDLRLRAPRERPCPVRQVSRRGLRLRVV